MTTPQLNTTDDVIDALGGTTEVAKLARRSQQAVSNWRSRLRGKFPAETYLILTQALKQKKLSAPLALWGIEEPQRRSA